MEDYFIKLAELDKSRRNIILYDRGFMDNMAYMSPEGISLLKEETKWDLEKMRDNRYDLVIHLVTAANGAEKYYTLKNNKARTEGIQQAIDVENSIKGIWNGHPHHMYR